jgi:hypothetical protein
MAHATEACRTRAPHIATIAVAVLSAFACARTVTDTGASGGKVAIVDAAPASSEGTGGSATQDSASSPSEGAAPIDGAGPPKASAAQLACFQSKVPVAPDLGCEVNGCYRGGDEMKICSAPYVAMMCAPQPRQPFPGTCWANHAYDGARNGFCCAPAQ